MKSKSLHELLQENKPTLPIHQHHWIAVYPQPWVLAYQCDLCGAVAP